MATRDEVYAKFGITAEAAQLLETELGTLLLCARGLQNGWHVIPDGERAQVALEQIDRSTLGRLLTTLKKHIELSDDLADRFASAFQARNRLNQGFFEKHNFKIQTDEGRDQILADLESLHDELFQAWQIASAMTAIAMQAIKEYTPEPISKL